MKQKALISSADIVDNALTNYAQNIVSNMEASNPSTFNLTFQSGILYFFIKENVNGFSILLARVD